MLIQRFVPRFLFNSDATSSETFEVTFDETVLSKLKITKAVLHDVTLIYENDINNISLPFKSNDSYEVWDSCTNLCRSCTHLTSPSKQSTPYPNNIEVATTGAAETDLQHICLYYLPSAISTCKNCEKRCFRVLN